MEDPAAESMLLVAPNRSVNLEGLIGPLYRIDLWWKSIEFHGAVWRVIYSNNGSLRGLSVLSAYAVNAAVALDLHSRFESICGPWRTDPDPVVGSDPS